MTRSNWMVSWAWEDGEQNRELLFFDGLMGVNSPNEGFSIDLTYAAALNLASKLLQWATNLPEDQKGNIHKIDGEWVDVDGHPKD